VPLEHREPWYAPYPVSTLGPASALPVAQRLLAFRAASRLVQGPKAAGGKAAKAKAELEKKQEDQRLSDLSEFERLEAERVVVEKNERKLLAGSRRCARRTRPARRAR
jgi:hypothetical protein